METKVADQSEAAGDSVAAAAATAETAASAVFKRVEHGEELGDNKEKEDITLEELDDEEEVIDDTE